MVAFLPGTRSRLIFSRSINPKKRIEVNEPMASITLQFSRPDFASEGFFDRAISEGICKETRAEICHVDAMIPQLNGSYTLIGAHIDGGIQERSATYETWGLRIRVTVQCTDAQAQAFYSYVRSMIGTPYDTKDILGIALGDGRLHDTSKMICSAFIAKALQDQKIGRVAKSYWLVDPDWLRGAVMGDRESIEERIEGNALC
jgi:hypothetical protein